jgi:hypothetical protein
MFNNCHTVHITRFEHEVFCNMCCCFLQPLLNPKDFFVFCVWRMLGGESMTSFIERLAKETFSIDTFVSYHLKVDYFFGWSLMADDAELKEYHL